MWSRMKSLLLTKIVSFVIMGLLVASIFFLPSVVRGYILFSGKDTAFYMPLLCVLYSSLLPAFALLFCLLRLLFCIGNGLVFTDENVLYLRIISWCCFAVSLIFGIFGFFYLLSVFITLAALFIGLIIRVIKNIFEHAIELKNENDLTI